VTSSSPTKVLSPDAKTVSVLSGGELFVFFFFYEYFVFSLSLEFYPCAPVAPEVRIVPDLVLAWIISLAAGFSGSPWGSLHLGSTSCFAFPHVKDLLVCFRPCLNFQTSTDNVRKNDFILENARRRFFRFGVKFQICDILKLFVQFFECVAQTVIA
jgi:hypothetical protein